MRGFVSLATLCAGLYFLWRADVLPGIWDLEHWGQDVELQARTERAEHRAARLAAFDAEGQEVPAVLFLGSSTIERMPLSELFAGASVLNRGIGDEPTELLLLRLDRGVDWSLVDGVVLYAGSVDFRRLGEEPEEIVGRVAEVVAAIRERAPSVPVLMLGLLSQRDLTVLQRGRLESTNRGLAELAEAEGVDFLATDRPPLTESGGRLSEAYAADRLHLNQRGYQVLGAWIRQNGGAVAPLLSR